MELGSACGSSGPQSSFKLSEVAGLGRAAGERICHLDLPANLSCTGGEPALHCLQRGADRCASDFVWMQVFILSRDGLLKLHHGNEVCSYHCCGSPKKPLGKKPPPCELQTSDPETDETESVYDHNQVTTETTWELNSSCSQSRGTSRQPRLRGRGRGPKCPLSSRGCSRAAKPLGQKEYGHQNTVLCFKEAQRSRKSKNKHTECGIERRVHKKNKMKRRGWNPKKTCIKKRLFRKWC